MTLPITSRCPTRLRHRFSSGFVEVFEQVAQHVVLVFSSLSLPTLTDVLEHAFQLGRLASSMAPSTLSMRSARCPSSRLRAAGGRAVEIGGAGSCGAAWRPRRSIR